MAVTINNATAEPAAATTKGKAVGFLNFYLPRKGGGKKKLGFVAFRGDNPNEKNLNDWLSADPARVAKLLSSLIADYQSATPSETSGFALPE
jgi:hypothetical protein